MELKIYADNEQLSAAAADIILSLLKENPTAVLCLATGDTPKLAYELVVKKAAAENVDFSQCYFVALDEWVGIEPTNEGSCRDFLQRTLFTPLKISEAQIHFFDGLSTDLESECRKMDEVIAAKNGIDLMLVGVGMNGHIGFNEPGVSTNLMAHVIELDEITTSVGQKYFQQNTKLSHGITLGLIHILQSRKLILMANGSKKSAVIKKVVQDPVGTAVPASYIREHANGIVMVDKEAASQLDA